MKTVEIKKSGESVAAILKRRRSALIKITDHGKLVAYILPADIYDEEDIGYMTDPRFWEMIRKSRDSGDGIPLEVVKREFKEKSRHASNGSAINGVPSPRRATKRGSSK